MERNGARRCYLMDKACHGIRCYGEHARLADGYEAVDGGVGRID